jgi:hypothetical protein
MARRPARTRTPTREKSLQTPLTVGEWVTFITGTPIATNSLPTWPPDAFGVAISILQRSGGYTVILDGWPPSRGRETHAWVGEIQDIGRRWRVAATKNPPMVPEEVLTWWAVVATARDQEVAHLRRDPNVCHALLQIVSAADEASTGVGVPAQLEAATDEFEFQAMLTLHSRKSTLCRTVPASRLVVLPKLHTPQVGLTVRSLSHHLALCPPSEIEARWWKMPFAERAVDSINLLLIPWPPAIVPTQFAPTNPPTAQYLNMPPGYGCFSYELLREPRGFATWVGGLVKAATKIVGSIDGVVLPECAVTERTFNRLAEALARLDVFLIAGIAAAGRGDSPGTNEMGFEVPLFSQRGLQVRQRKHHKWCLDRRQITQYGLGSRLDPNRLWWEHVKIGGRAVSFVALRPWLTVAGLICEDLARQDPIGDFVRAVGPNLVVALLMDGPQLGTRWPARYATVLADDPGSSVLTLTSRGMTDLSRPYGAPDPLPIVGMWKDAKSSDPVALKLPPTFDALALCLTAQYFTEWTADGRDDHQGTAYPVLSGVHPVKAPHPLSRTEPEV